MGFDIIDGELWDEETGEYAGPASGWITGEESPEDLALLVMRKRMDIEAAIDAETAKMHAILANCQAIIGKQSRRLDWLQRRYDAQLQDYALSQLPRKADGTLKVKTWTCPYGAVSFRTIAERVKVVDEEETVAWLTQKPSRQSTPCWLANLATLLRSMRLDLRLFQPPNRSP
jgi:hypothetical protein